MPHSLKSKVKSLCYKGEITEQERDRIIRALEQTELNPSYNGVKSELKPCEDCISRQVVLDIWHTRYSNIREENEEIQYKKIAFELPSVTPTRPKGEWKALNYKDEMWGYVYKCSNCGAIEYGDNYCPNCGAKMEVEE